MKLYTEVAGVTEIISFGHPKKGKERYFFQITQLLVWNARFIIAASDGLSKIICTSKENSYSWAKIFKFYKLQLPRNQLRRQMFINKVFYKLVFGFFLIQFIPCEILIYVLYHIFHSWLE